MALPWRRTDKNAMNPRDVIRILIADDHPIMRAGLRSALDRECDMKVIGEAADGAEAIEHCRELKPDLVIMDLQMPRIDGIQAIKAIHEQDPCVRIVVLTTYPGDARIDCALSAGATSYLLKTSDHAEIAETVRLAYIGRKHLAADVQSEITQSRGMDALNTREISVLDLASQGNSNRQIGEHLRVSEETIKTRIKSILSKLQARDRTHAVKIAIHRGYIEF
jgi:DNA-binding NarL/FixJ family response regulator